MRPVHYLFTPLIALVFCAPLAAQLEWKSKEVSQAAKVEATEAVAKYEFTNKGKEAVTIEAVSTSCGCTAATPDKTTYQPGESGQIEAKFSFGTRTGKQHKRITVRSKTGDKPVRDTLTLKVDIPVLAQVSPGFVFWRLPSTKEASGELADKEAPPASEAAEGIEAKVVRITFDSDKPLKVLEATSSDSSLKTQVREIEPGKVYEVSIQPEKLDGQLNATITIKTNADVERWQTLTARARVLGGASQATKQQVSEKAPQAVTGSERPELPERFRSKLKSDARMLVWSMGDKAEAKTVMIESQEEEPIKDVKTRILGKGFTAAIKEEEAGKRYQLTVTPENTDAPQGGIVIVSYSTEEAKGRHMPLRVSLRVRPGRTAEPAAEAEAP